MARPDFERVAATLLARAEQLVPAWLPAGRRRGHEWVCGDLRGEPGESCSVNLGTGAWSDFATGEKGGDLIALYAAMHGTTQLEALRSLDGEAQRPGGEARSPSGEAQNSGEVRHATPVAAAVETPGAPPSPDSAPPESLPSEAPQDAPLPSPAGHTDRWVYHSAGGAPLLVVCRFETPEGKTFRQYTWRDGRWVAKGYGECRPLYRLPDVLKSPERRVLVVEGEKAAEAARAALDESWCVTTWAAGAKAIRKTDWAPLKRREVVLWPDADDAGRAAMAELAAVLIGVHAAVSVVPTAAFPEKWDAADAGPASIPDIVATAKPVQAPKRETRSAPRPLGGATLEQNGALCDSGSAFVSWQSLGLECNGNGQPFATLSNVNVVLSKHPKIAGNIWLDKFDGRIYHALYGDAALWADADALRLTAWIQQTLQLPKVGLDLMHQAIALCAANNARNSLTEWLDSLRWDGTPRLEHWLADYLGVARTPFTVAVAQNWLVSMVARAYLPGCQADHMPVLEGASGAGKSSALAILGGRWYKAAPQAFGSKEFLEAIQGSWLTEIPDMVGFGRREHSQIIAAITTRTDTYRKSYGRNAEDHPRGGIFAATSETDDYLQDSRGKRRYWPLRCTEINLAGLAASRDQLFAEAVTAFRAGAKWHDVPIAEAREEQAAREQGDPWAERIDAFASSRCATYGFVTVTEILTDCVEIPLGKQTDTDVKHAAKCLKSLGFIGKVERDGRRTERRYRLLPA